jgi:very-short-patch-repair endonuclease
LLCDLHALPRPHCQEWIEEWRVDFLWPAARLVAESDGAGVHRGEHRRTDDVRRDRRLHELGYRVRRLSYEQVTYEPERTVARLREALTA